MNKTKVFYFILGTILIVSVLSCNKKYRPFPEEFSQEINIKVSQLSDFSKDSIGNPSIIYSFNKYVILTEIDNDKIISIYNTEDHTLQRFQNKGRGPGELLGISHISSSDDSSFYVLDPFSNTVATYHIKDSIEKTTYEKMRQPISAYFYNKTISLSIQVGEDKYKIHESLLNQTNKFGDLFELPGHTPELVSFLEGYSVISFEQGRVAWFSMFGDLFEIYDFNKVDSCKLITRRIGILPVFKKMRSKKGERPVFLPETKLGVNSVTSNKSNIFFLYNEHEIRDEIIKNEDTYFSDMILVYDWYGNPMKIILLDKKIKSFSYNEYDSTFYCLSRNDEGETIVVFFQI